MKLQIETNLVGRIRRTRPVVFVILALFAASLVVGIVGNNNRSIVRDFIIANIAHVESGDVIEFGEDEGGYIRGLPLNEDYSYSIKTNSTWVSDYVRLIVPYMYYEGLTSFPAYPMVAAVVPMLGNDSFHVAGRMIPKVASYDIFLNERIILDARWGDKRMALEVLVHELVHGQRGAFIMGGSEALESATSTATMEVLAAMCNYGDDLACRSFWWELENLSRTSLLLALQEKGLLPLYEAWADIFWRDGTEIVAYHKGMRRWAEDPLQLATLRKKYSKIPYDRIVAVMTEGYVLNTMNKQCVQVGATAYAQNQTCMIMGLEFDDVFYKLEFLQFIFKLGD
jgi:hypothetical protein